MSEKKMFKFILGIREKPRKSGRKKLSSRLNDMSEVKKYIK